MGSSHSPAVRSATARETASNRRLCSVLRRHSGTLAHGRLLTREWLLGRFDASVPEWGGVYRGERQTAARWRSPRSRRVAAGAVRDHGQFGQALRRRSLARSLKSGFIALG